MTNEAGARPEVQERERHRLLKEFGENALRFFYGEGRNQGIMLSPERAEIYNHLHQDLLRLVQYGAIDNVVGQTKG